MKVTAFGTGYVGLRQGAVLADTGYHVMCVDVDAATVERLKKGEVPLLMACVKPPVVYSWKRYGKPVPRYTYEAEAMEETQRIYGNHDLGDRHRVAKASVHGALT